MRMTPAENAATPEALVYEPQPNGRLRLVAVSNTSSRSRRSVCSTPIASMTGTGAALCCSLVPRSF